MQILQLNMQKRREVQHSVINDASPKEYAALAVSEPYIFDMGGVVRTSPMALRSWTAVPPSIRHNGRWAVRSILRAHKDIEREQMNVPLADLTEVLLRLPDRRVFLASVYVERANATALDKTVLLLDGTIRTTRQRGGPRLDVVVVGDFNRHGQLYGGGEVLTSRQSDANTIIDFMDRWPLDNLLPYGTETWQMGRARSGQHADAQSRPVPVRKALVDQGPYEAPPGLHILDEQNACAKTR